MENKGLLYRVKEMRKEKTRKVLASLFEKARADLVKQHARKDEKGKDGICRALNTKKCTRCDNEGEDEVI